MTNVDPCGFNPHPPGEVSLGASSRLRILREFALQQFDLILGQPWLRLGLLGAVHASLADHDYALLLLLLLLLREKARPWCIPALIFHMSFLRRGRRSLRLGLGLGLATERLHIDGGVLPLPEVHHLCIHCAGLMRC